MGLVRQGGPAVWQLFDGDVIGIDQRRTGRSRPNLKGIEGVRPWIATEIPENKTQHRRCRGGRKARTDGSGQEI